ncbi:septum formation initiator family protein [candidate division KSB1 bacterium]|nr:septum formation initiator family protein [candidate division KSB1 bacterium]
MKKKLTKSRRQALSKKRIRLLIAFGVLTLLVILFVGGDRGLYQIWKLSREKKHLEEQIEGLKHVEAEMKKREKKLQDDPEYLEKVAREKYGMIKKGEKVYRVEWEEKK